MKPLRKRIKKIILSHNGLPSLNRDEYLKEMARLILNSLSETEKTQLKKNTKSLEYLIIEISREIAEEIL